MRRWAVEKVNRKMSKAISQSKQAAVWEKTGGRCWYCGKQTRRVDWADVMNQRNKDGTKKSDNDHWFTIEHVIPLSLGGTNNIDNLLPACRKCNCTKNKKTIGEYREYVSRMRVGAPAFTDEQIEYLRENGIELPEIEQVIFWGER